MNSVKRRAATFLLAGAPWSPWLAPRAYAEESTTVVSEDERTDRARGLFGDGVAAFAAGRYHSAIELFTEADRIQPRPELSFDIARSYENLDDDVAAVSFYREYLRRAGHPSDEAEVRKRIERLASRRVSPAPGWDTDDGARIVSTETLSGPLAREGPAPTKSPAGDRAADDSSKLLTTMGWVGLGAAAAAFGGAIVFEVMRANAESAAEGERQQIQFDHYVHTMETDRTTARVLFGTGAAFALAGGILLYLGKDQADVSKPAPRVALRVLPEAVTADASWRF